MEVDMAVDAVLWFILAAAIGFIACGCVCTGGAAEQFPPRHG
jgi:hypothetical protein